MYGLNVVIYIFIFSKCMFHGDLELVSFSLHLSLSLSLAPLICLIDLYMFISTCLLIDLYIDTKRI